MKESIHLRLSAKPESSAVLLLHEAPKHARWPGSHVTVSHKIQTQMSGETALFLQPANSDPSGWRLKPPAKSLQPGD